jgi:Phage Terminase
MKHFTVDRVLTDTRLLGAALGDIAPWERWLVGIKAAFGLGLITDRERELFADMAGDRKPPERRVRELWCLIGRRGGKSRMAAALAVYCAFFLPVKLAPGEIGVVLVLAGSLDQAGAVFEYIRKFIELSPVLRKEIESTTKTEIRLKSGIVIAVHAASFRNIRGRTILCCIFDEVAFWRSEDSAAPDTEVYSAVLPSLSTTRGLLIAISTPYRKAGLLFQKHRDCFGVDDGNDVLVIQGETAKFNPTLGAGEIASQMKADPTAAQAEWGAQFRGDLSAFLSDELIERAIDYDRPIELPAMTAT